MQRRITWKLKEMLRLIIMPHRQPLLISQPLWNPETKFLQSFKKSILEWHWLASESEEDTRRNLDVNHMRIVPGTLASCKQQRCSNGTLQNFFMKLSTRGRINWVLYLIYIGVKLLRVFLVHVSFVTSIILVKL